jgi:hypothetical protein
MTVVGFKIEMELEKEDLELEALGALRDGWQIRPA